MYTVYRNYTVHVKWTTKGMKVKANKRTSNIWNTINIKTIRAQKLSNKSLDSGRRKTLMGTHGRMFILKIINGSSGIMHSQAPNFKSRDKCLSKLLPCSPPYFISQLFKYIYLATGTYFPYQHYYYYCY